jgi:hypothetical protein
MPESGFGIAPRRKCPCGSSLAGRRLAEFPLSWSAALVMLRNLHTCAAQTELGHLMLPRLYSLAPVMPATVDGPDDLHFFVIVNVAAAASVHPKPYSCRRDRGRSYKLDMFAQPLIYHDCPC